MVDPAPIASITEHLRGAYGFIMKSAANGSHFRVLPLRDPDQHRFWCVVVVRILPGGDPDRSHPAWIGLRGLRREELSEIMATIRDGLEPWLADPAQKALRDWVATPDTSVVTNDAMKSQTPDRSVSSNGRSGTGQSGIAHSGPHLNYPSDTGVAGAVA